MYSNTIDNKDTYTDKENYLMVDLGESIFDSNNIYIGVNCNLLYGAPNMNMRPDNFSYDIYKTEVYAELLLKYNDIQNPFSLSSEDLFIVPSMVDIEKHVGKPKKYEKSSVDALIRNYHKYIDKSKLPDTNGSETDKTSISKNEPVADKKFQESNLAPEGAKAITEVGNRLYFGTDSGMECAANGISTAELYEQIIKANI